MSRQPAALRRWFGVFFLSLGVAMIVVDVTVVAVAVPYVIDDLGIGSTTVQWVQETYTLVFAALLLTLGRAADRWGRRGVFVAGAVVFIVASILAATAGSGAELIGARVIQGIGGAAMLPTSLALLSTNFSGGERRVALAVWGATLGGAGALGPLLGGWLTTDFSWRWAFGINVPAGLAVVVGVLSCVRESVEARTRTGIDWPGSALSIVGLGGIVFALIEGRVYGWWAPDEPFSVGSLGWPLPLSPVPVAATVGVMALAGFIHVELRRNRAGQAVLLDLALFRIRSFRTGNLIAAVVSLGEFGLLFALPLWLQNVRGYSAFETGLVLLPMALGVFAAGALVASLTARLGAGFVVRSGLVLELIGVVGLGAVLAPGVSWAVTTPFLVMYGFGVGLATTSLTGTILAEVPAHQSGQASGTQSAVRQVGAAFGVAVLGTVLLSGASGYLRSDLAGTAIPKQRQAEIARSVEISAGTSIAGLAAEPQTAVAAAPARTAFTRATRDCALVAGGFLAAGLVVTVGLSRQVAPARPDRPAVAALVRRPLEPVVRVPRPVPAGGARRSGGGVVVVRIPPELRRPRSRPLIPAGALRYLL